MKRECVPRVGKREKGPVDIHTVAVETTACEECVNGRTVFQAARGKRGGRVHLEAECTRETPMKNLERTSAPTG